MRSKSLPAYVSLVLAFGVGALAQVEMAECLPGWEWNRNSLDQDPCTVGATLDATCRGKISYNYDKLEKDHYYVSPSKNHTGDSTCDCNTVMYSLIMACSICQEARAWSWSSWIHACETVYVAQYPSDIPQGTAIPQWAFFNVTTLANGTYSDENAKSVGRNPEVLPRKLSTLTTSGGPTATGASGGKSRSSSSKTGAIVGGVVGGVAALVIIGIIIFFLIRRGRQNGDGNPQPQPQPQYQHQGAHDNPWKLSPTSPMYDPSISSGPTIISNVPFQPYNPGDPSTFPPPIPMGQTSPVTYVTPISNYHGGGR